MLNPKSAAIALLTASLCVAAIGCFAPSTPEARVLEVAQEMKMATRFGQVEVAMEHVDEPARAAYVARHAVWASELRIVDVELVGVDVQADKVHADVELAVTWQANDEAVVRSTNVRQRYRDDRGTWRLETEKAGRGDGELFARVARSEKRRRAEQQGASASDAAEPKTVDKKSRAFETRTIGASEGSYDGPDMTPAHD